jgi:hypothetical protein
VSVAEEQQISVDVHVGAVAVRVVAGDFNGDTRVAMFAANENIFVGAIFLNTCQAPKTIPTATSTITPVQLSPTSSSTSQPPTSTSIATSTQAPATATSTSMPSAMATTGVPPTATVCALTFTDVQPDSTFYSFIRCLVCRGIVSGYDDGTFRPFNDITRGQIAKIVANAAGIGGTPSGQFYADVQEDNPFYLWIMRLTEQGVMSGYDCGGEAEPCDEEQRPYFRPFNNVTRGQASKIVANTFLPGCQTP